MEGIGSAVTGGLVAGVVRSAVVFDMVKSDECGVISEQ
jgi:hypothetical protein